MLNNGAFFAKHSFACITVLAAGALFSTPATGAVIYNNLTPNNQMAVATRAETAGNSEIEAADDFILNAQSFIDTASFVGLAVPGTSGTFSISDIVIEVYRVFPLDSDTNRTQNVPTRVNSPSDVAFDSKDSGAGELSFGTSVLSTTFTALNSVQPGGIHAKPLQNTLGNGPLTGEEIQFDVTFNTPFDLPADHYFFVPQVTLTNGAQFYWLSASRPISGSGTTPLATDLQAWTRDAGLDPDWLRVGTDIVGGATPPTFNQAFSLQGTVAPEPGTILLGIAGLALVGLKRYRGAR
jgi:hypothetical protein